MFSQSHGLPNRVIAIPDAVPQEVAARCLERRFFKGVEGLMLEVFLVNFVKFRRSVSSHYVPNRIPSLPRLDSTCRKARVWRLESSRRHLGPIFWT